MDSTPLGASGASDVSLTRPIGSPLDRVIPITIGSISGWLLLGWIVTIVAALALRLLRLDSVALDASEATWAYNGWILFRGQPSLSGQPIPDSGAAFLLLQGLVFFLFGATDVVARLAPVLAGLALVFLPLALRRWLGMPAVLGMAGLIALSPTLVYASRVVSPEIVVALLALAAAVVLIRLGERAAGDAPSISRLETRRSAAVIGALGGIALATAPSAISVALTVVIGIALAGFAAPEGTIRAGGRALRDAWWIALLAFVLAALLGFTRFLSNPAGIAGAGETLRAWWTLLTSGGEQPVQVFLLILLVYEPIAILFAIAALVRTEEREAVVLFGGWFAAAFALWSFSAGRSPAQAIHVVLPLLLVAGIALGALLHEIAWREVWNGRGVLLVLAMLGVLAGLSAVGVLASRVQPTSADLRERLAAAAPPVAVFALVVMPLLYLIWRLSIDARDTDDRRLPGTMLLLVLTILLGGLGLRSATLLTYGRADLGLELLAQRTATLGTLPSVERFLRLARDVGVSEGTARDPTGSHSLSLAVEEDVRWPYVWYFREFPDLTVVPPGAGPSAGAQVVFAATDAGMTAAGYTAQTWPWLNTVPPHYLDPDIGDLFGALVTPWRWREIWHYLLFREGVPLPPPAMVTVGLAPDLAQRVTVRSGPFDLADRAGPGTEPGQFTDPIGVAVGRDGTIAVVDSGNARLERFNRDGDLLDVWGDGANGVSFTRTENGLGPTGVTIAPDGTIWVADTWGHRVVALDASGAIVQTIGGEIYDTGDDPARVGEAGGRFFGPRDIAIGDDAIYVSDTGNERVQRFTRDGTFVSTWGGYGTGLGQLIEPVGIAVGPDGNIYVADSGNARIAIFTPDGTPAGEWPVPDWPKTQPGGLPPAYQPYLAFDANGDLYATASNAAEAIVLDRNGAIVARLSAAGAERLSQPIGVAIAPDGAVLLTDVGRDAVLETAPPASLDAEDLDAEDAGATP
ncbi:MAG: hypothetical protein U0031_19035 [Thermomicrobiales bacterium]